MAVLTGKTIERRASGIFKDGSWCSESCQEASYDLRIDTEHYLRIGGKLYDKSERYEKSTIEIKPGELAMLPTVESFCMPDDLVGDIKIKFRYSRQGLTPLFGPKVDPWFGYGHEDERLYLWVSNLGLQSIVLERYEAVFTVQFHELDEPMTTPVKKEAIGPKVAKEIRHAGIGQFLGFTDAIKTQMRCEFESNLSGVESKLRNRLNRVEDEFDTRLNRVEQGTGQVVTFGVFLVASALLAGILGVILAIVLASQASSELAARSILVSLSWENPLLWLVVIFTGFVVTLTVFAVLRLADTNNGSVRKKDASIDGHT